MLRNAFLRTLPNGTSFYLDNVLYKVIETQNNDSNVYCRDAVFRLVWQIKSGAIVSAVPKSERYFDAKLGKYSVRL